MQNFQFSSVKNCFVLIIFMMNGEVSEVGQVKLGNVKLVWMKSF